MTMSSTHIFFYFAKVRKHVETKNIKRYILKHFFDKRMRIYMQLSPFI